MNKSLVLLGIILLVSGCVSGPPALASFQSAPISNRSTLTIVLTQNGPLSVVARLSGGWLGNAVVTADAVRQGEGWLLSLEKLNWFNNWANGWTQASFLLDGEAQVLPQASGWVFRVTKAPTLDAVDQASIRYFDTYVRGEDGVVEFSRRWARIHAATGDLLARKALPVLEPRGLEHYLFPEIYGYNSPPKTHHGQVSSQGFAWDTDYTHDHFAQPLWILRNSGTLLRDYKESPGLWLLALNWKSLWGQSDLALVVKRK